VYLQHKILSLQQIHREASFFLQRHRSLRELQLHALEQHGWNGRTHSQELSFACQILSVPKFSGPFRQSVSTVLIYYSQVVQILKSIVRKEDQKRKRSSAGL
jgi:hypothetical protein